ncbi:hypothetical protein N7528_006831 [Penicillium herquei]|nr:hypothetical protein N7528_006831 [Penicillium herquei]
MRPCDQKSPPSRRTRAENLTNSNKRKQPESDKFLLGKAKLSPARGESALDDEKEVSDVHVEHIGVIWPQSHTSSLAISAPEYAAKVLGRGICRVAHVS